MALTPKQIAFIDEYFKDFNATQAAVRAGYSEKTAYNSGWENVRKREIAEVISKRLSETAMSSDEVIKRLGDMARADIADFSTLERIADLKGEEYKGKSHVIKKFKRKITRDTKNDTEYEEIEIELYPADTNLERIGKVHGLFTDKVEHTGEIDLSVKYVNDWRDTKPEGN